MNFLNDKEKYLLALYLKRMTFDDAYELAQDKDEAYAILAVVEQVQKELADLGFAPR